MTVIDIVMIKPDVVRVGLGAILEGEFLAILDMVFKSAVVHSEPSWFVSDALLVFLVGGFVG